MKHSVRTAVLWHLSALVVATGAVANANGKSGGAMTREEAGRTVQALFRRANMTSSGLNDKGFGGLMIGKAQLYFEHRAKETDLVCRAHIFTFRKEPRPGVIDGLRKEETRGALTGGGHVEYMTENSGVFLTRHYLQPVAEGTFLADMDALANASLVWRDDVLPRVFEATRPRTPPAR